VWHHHRRDDAGMHRQAFGYGVGLGHTSRSLSSTDPPRYCSSRPQFRPGWCIFSLPRRPRTSVLRTTTRSTGVAGAAWHLGRDALIRAQSSRFAACADESIAVGSHSFSPAPTARRQIR
jgi:hypothetical protein